MASDPKVVMTIEIGEDGQVVSVKGKEGTKVKEYDADSQPDMPVGTITRFIPMTVFCAHNSPDCWYFYAGRWWQLC